MSSGLGQPLFQGRHLCLWRAVDCEGEILGMLVQSKRDKVAALRLMRKLLKKKGLCSKGARD
jgi:putative transposase